MLQSAVAVDFHITDVENLNKTRDIGLSQVTEVIKEKLHVSLNDPPSPKPVVSQSAAASQAEGILQNHACLLLLLLGALCTEI